MFIKININILEIKIKQKMNLNNLTKAELISKINQIKKEKLESKNELNKQKEKLESKINLNKQNDKRQTDTTFLELILKLKNLILSLSIIAVLMNLFKNYKTIRNVLKLANFIVLTIFGISMFEAFGLGFIVRMLGELKYIFGAVVAYLTDTTFYKYLMKSFNAVEEENEVSVRAKYSKPVETNWKEEFEKAERQREIEKWKERYASHKAESDSGDKLKMIGIIILLLGGTIAVYYNKELLEAFSPIWNLGNLIKSILRGGRPGDDDNENGSIQLGPDSRAVSPEMLVYSSEQVDPNATPKPKSPTIGNPPPNYTEDEAKPLTLMEQIQLGKTLKKTKTNERKTGYKTGNVIDNSSSDTGTIAESTNSNDTSLLGRLKSSFDKMRPMIDDDNDDEIPEQSNKWDDSTETTLVKEDSIINKEDSQVKIDKGKGKEIADSTIIENKPEISKKKRFLDSIKLDEKKIESSSGISPVLKPVIDRFPNLSKDTLLKLSTPEGLKNRWKIIQSLSDAELEGAILPIEDKLEQTMESIPKPVKISELTGESKAEFDKIINSTLDLSAEEVVKIVQQKFPHVDFGVNSYKDEFIKATEEEINSGKTLEEKEAIRKEIQKVDLDEIQKTIGTSNTKEIKNVLRENYTYNKLLESIKEIKKDKTLEELTSDKIVDNMSPDMAITLVEDLDKDLDKDKQASLILKSVDFTLSRMIDENPGWNKQQLVEKLLKENPVHKDKILETVSLTVDNQIHAFSKILSTKDYNKMVKVLVKEDVKEMGDLGENRNVEQIKTLAHVNRTHNKLLHEIKSKASQMSLKGSDNNNTNDSIEQFNNTMDLFE